MDAKHEQQTDLFSRDDLSDTEFGPHSRLIGSQPLQKHKKPQTCLIFLFICAIEALQIGFYVYSTSTLRQISTNVSRGKMAPELQAYYDLTISTTEPGKLFRDNETFKMAPENEKDLLWKSRFPRSGGIISLSSAFVAQAKLPPSSPDPDKADQYVYNLGVFHQLHCLNVLRYGLRLRGAETLEITLPHIEHCLEYLRQGIECSADMTLLSTTDLEDFGTSLEDRHVCRDIDGIRTWADENRFHDYLHIMKQLHPEVFMTTPK